jgi:antitoxin component of MazEF toxin-antitoxin module
MIVEPGRIVVEPVKRRPTLDEMLAEFDPAIHGGEAMAFEPLGKEVP